MIQLAGQPLGGFAAFCDWREVVEAQLHAPRLGHDKYHVTFGRRQLAQGGEARVVAISGAQQPRHQGVHVSS